MHFGIVPRASPERLETQPAIPPDLRKSRAVEWIQMLASNVQDTPL